MVAPTWHDCERWMKWGLPCPGGLHKVKKGKRGSAGIPSLDLPDAPEAVPSVGRHPVPVKDGELHEDRILDDLLGPQRERQTAPAFGSALAVGVALAVNLIAALPNILRPPVVITMRGIVQLLRRPRPVQTIRKSFRIVARIPPINHAARRPAAHISNPNIEVLTERLESLYTTATLFIQPLPLTRHPRGQPAR